MSRIKKLSETDEWAYARRLLEVQDPETQLANALSAMRLRLQAIHARPIYRDCLTFARQQRRFTGNAAIASLHPPYCETYVRYSLKLLADDDLLCRQRIKLTHADGTEWLYTLSDFGKAVMACEVGND